MTREEAVMVLNMVEAHGLADKAKRMAIKALEFDLDRHDEEVIKNTVETLWGEPCDDAISRQAVLDACDQSINIFDATDRIKELASVKPKVKECEDCISREAAIKVFGDVHPMDYNTQAYITNIQNLPSVKPKTKIGHWILYRDHKNMVDYPQCDNCGVIIKLPLPIDNLNYCPNCGCRMVES